MPERAELPKRLASVLAVVYLLFNEGHIGRQGPWIRLDLQAEALRLVRHLCDLLPSEPEVFGLFALISFSVARAATRTDAAGEMVLLAEQERLRWDRPTIKEGLIALLRARRLGSYGLQAEIAACHATAETWESTDWSRILAWYDELLALAPSPVVALNRSVAVCMHEGPKEALAALSALEGSSRATTSSTRLVPTSGGASGRTRETTTDAPETSPATTASGAFFRDGSTRPSKRDVDFRPAGSSSG